MTPKYWRSMQGSLYHICTSPNLPARCGARLQWAYTKEVDDARPIKPKYGFCERCQSRKHSYDEMRGAQS